MDKDQSPKDMGASDTPELRETLEDEVKLDAGTEEVKAEEPKSESESKPESEANSKADDKKEPKNEAPITPEPTPAPELITATPPKESNNKIIIIILVAGILLSAGLVIFGFMMINNKTSKPADVDQLVDTATDLLKDTEEKLAKQKEETEKKQKEEKEKREKEEKEKAEKEKQQKEQEELEKKKAAEKEALKTTLKADGVLSHVKDELANTVNVEGVSFNITKDKATFYQPAEYKTHIYLGEGALSIGSSEKLIDTQYTNTFIQKTTNNILEELGFKQIESIDNPLIYTSNLTIFYNSATNVVCTSYAYLEPLMGCSAATDYDLSGKSLVNSLAEAYNKSEGKYPLVVSAQSSGIKDTGYKKYQTITPFIGHNAMSLFYRESPSSDWKYLLSTQAVIDCSIYSNELQKGLGEYCKSN